MAARAESVISQESGVSSRSPTLVARALITKFIVVNRGFFQTDTFPCFVPQTKSCSDIV